MLPRNSMGGIRRTGDPLEIFESGRAMQVLRYICANDGCLRTDLYRDISRNAKMPSKIDELSLAGLIEPEADGPVVRLHPTDAGMRVSELLGEISSIIEGADRPPDS